jgi:Zn-dependent oligopeptidase
LTDLEQTLHPLGVQEHEKLLQLKADELKAREEPFDGEFYIWDYQYYKHLYLEKSPHLRLDHNYIKEYFPASAVIPATLEIFQNVFGVSFQEIKGSQTWHPDVQLFAVWNADAKVDLDFVGYCYLDLFQRGGLPCFYTSFQHIYTKFLILLASKCVYDSDAAVQLLCPGYLLSNGKRAYPVVAMTTNLAKATPNCPSLMLHSDVIQFFHEMGNVFHNLLSCTQFSYHHGTRANFKVAKLVENWYVSSYVKCMHALILQCVLTLAGVGNQKS